MLRGASKPVSSLVTTIRISGSSPNLNALMICVCTFGLAVALHHPLPEGDDLLAGLLVVHLVEALAVIGRRDDDLAGDVPDLVEELPCTSAAAALVGATSCALNPVPCQFWRKCSLMSKARM